MSGSTLRQAIAACLRSGLLLAGAWCGALHAQSLQLELDALSGTEWSAKKVQLALANRGAAKLAFKGLVAQGRDLGDVAVECKRFTFESNLLKCEDGQLQGAARWPLSFSYDIPRKLLRLSVMPEAGEEWRLDITGGEWLVGFTNASLARVAPLLTAPGAASAAGAIKPTGGRVTGTLRYGPSRIETDLQITDGAFADAAGLRAGEKLQGRWTVDATRAGTAWNWQSTLQWDKGAVFWDPVYVALEDVAPGHRLTARGTQTAERVSIEQASLDWRGVGQLAGSIDFGIKTFDVGRFALDGRGLQLAGLRALLPQTWLDEHRLADLVIHGGADIALVGQGSRVERLALALTNAGVQAPLRELALDKLDFQFGYSPAGRQPFHLNADALRVRDLSFGPIRSTGEMRDGRLFIPNLVAPVLDGFLALAEIEIDRDAFQLQGALTAVSMEKLTTALHWHPLGGQLAFVLPRVSYAKSTLSVDGALLFKLFGGDAQVDAVRLENPFGRTPQLTANLHLKRLNLEEMTAAVKFGTITGFVDVDVEGLVMEKWQPVSMDARVLTSDGAFTKRISQRAVQNISSIGGAGAGAAIQRSFLGFFETFGYDKIGLSCKLRNGICEMGGAGNAAGGFMLIKGGGLPSVNVVGYNQFVGWQELLDRIQAVIDGNSRPVFQ